MTGPGPSQEQLADILLAGARVPDHGKLFPWRFIIFEGEGLSRFADILTEILGQEGVAPVTSRNGVTVSSVYRW